MKRSTNGFSQTAVLLCAALLGTTACAGQNFSPASLSTVGEAPLEAPLNDTPAAQDPSQKIDHYQNRYDLGDTHTKLVDDRGNGFSALYGTRNVRAVLSGVVYRGGANNLYNKFGKRANMNPLPDLGLKNLCKEGFGTAVYLYSTNFSSATKETNCQKADSSANKLNYYSYSPFSDANVLTIFQKVQTALTHPETGPIYLHCWNGWHASGLISALILRQYCGLSGDAAVKYWEINTDGNAPEAKYGDIRKRIRDFTPKAAFTISNELRQQVCPH